MAKRCEAGIALLILVVLTSLPAFATRKDLGSRSQGSFVGGGFKDCTPDLGTTCYFFGSPLHSEGAFSGMGGRIDSLNCGHVPCDGRAVVANVVVFNSVLTGQTYTLNLGSASRGWGVYLCSPNDNAIAPAGYCTDLSKLPSYLQRVQFDSNGDPVGNVNLSGLAHMEQRGGKVFITFTSEGASVGTWVFTRAVVPEPGSLALFGSGLGLLATGMRRRWFRG